MPAAILLLWGCGVLSSTVDGQCRPGPDLADVDLYGDECWGLSWKYDPQYLDHVQLGRIAPPTRIVEKLDFMGENMLFGGSIDGGIAAVAFDDKGKQPAKLYWHAIGSRENSRSDTLLPAGRYVGITTVGTSIWVIAQSRLFQISRAEGKPLQIAKTILITPRSVLVHQPGHRMHSVMLKRGLLYIGFDNGEWGGGLYRVDTRNGKAIEIQNDFHGKNELRDLPVIGMVQSPWNEQCLYVALSLTHMDFRAGRVVLVCQGKAAETFFARLAPDGMGFLLPNGDKPTETVRYEFASEPVTRIWNNQGQIEIDTWYGIYQLNGLKSYSIIEQHNKAVH